MMMRMMKTRRKQAGLVALAGVVALAVLAVLGGFDLAPSKTGLRSEIDGEDDMGSLVAQSAEMSEVPNVYGDKFSTYHCRLHQTPGSLPDFFVIGVHKGGSTAIYGYLAQHGNIRPAKCKETLFFENGKRWRLGFDFYLKLFPDTSATPGVLTGEGTPGYIRHPQAVVRILEHVPHGKFIVSFRDPVDRFVSHFVGFYHRGQIPFKCPLYFTKQVAKLDRCMERYDAAAHVLLETDTETETAWDALKRLADPDSLARFLQGQTASPPSIPGTCSDDDLHCKRRYCMGRLLDETLVRSVYVDQLVRWLRYFPPEQFFVVQSEAMFRDVPGTLNELAAFLGVRNFNDAELERFEKKTNTGTSHHSMKLFGTCNVTAMKDFYGPENELFLAVLKGQFPQNYARWLPWQG